MMSETLPQPPMGSFHLAARISSSAAVTKLGREIPISVIDKLDQSSTPPRRTAASVPTATPTSTAIISAKNPSVTDTGSEDFTMSLTDHSLYCIDGPKSPKRMMLYGYHARNSPALLA